MRDFHQSSCGWINFQVDKTPSVVVIARGQATSTPWIATTKHVHSRPNPTYVGIVRMLLFASSKVFWLQKKKKCNVFVFFLLCPLKVPSYRLTPSPVHARTVTEYTVRTQCPSQCMRSGHCLRSLLACRHFSTRQTVVT